MRRLLLILTVFVIGAGAAGPSAINPDLRAKIWRARTEYLSALDQMKTAKAKIESLAAEACPGSTLVEDQLGEPSCAEKKQ